jgi:adenylate cyclase
METGKDDPDALWMAGFTLALFSGDHTTGMTWVNHALLLNPNAAYAWFARGWVPAMKGQPDTAIDGFQRAARLSPLDPLGWMFSGARPSLT